MNTDTGRIYTGADIEKAMARGEPVVPVSERVAQLMSMGEEPEQLLNRAERRRREQAARSEMRRISRSAKRGLAR